MSTTEHAPGHEGEAAFAADRPAVLWVGERGKLLVRDAALEGLGVHFVCATSVEEGLRRLSAPSCVAVVLEIGTAGSGVAATSDGYAVARRIRAEQQLEHVPMICLSALPFPEPAQLEGCGHAAIELLCLPSADSQIVPRLLRSKLVLLLELHRQRNELHELERSLQIMRTQFRERSAATATELAALRSSDSRYRAIFEHPNEVTVVIEAVRDASGTITDWRYLDANANALALLQRPRGHVVGALLSEVLGAAAGNVIELCARALASGQPYRYERQYAGQELQICLFPIGANTIVSSAIDVTSRTEATREIERQSAVTRAEKEWLAAVLNSMNEEVYFTDTQKRYTCANPAAKRELGHAGVEEMRIEQLVSTLEVLRPDGTPRPASESPSLRALAGEVVKAEEHIVRIPRSGELRNRQVSAAPVRDASGAIIGSVAVVRDVTEQRRVDASLRAREARAGALLRLGDQFRSLSEPVEVAFAAAKFLGETLAINRCGYGIIDVASATIVIERDWCAPGTASVAGVLHFRDYGTYVEALTRGETVICCDTDTDTRTLASLRALRALDVRAFINMPIIEQSGTVALLYLTHGEPRHWSEDELSLIREVAERTRVTVERRRSEHALRSSEQRLREADKRKDEFLAMLSHELRNPLAAIGNIAQLLTQLLAGRSKESSLLAAQQRQIGQLARLLDDLMDVARITQGRIELRMEPVAVESFIQLALDTAEPLIRQRRHELSVTPAPMPMAVMGDRTRLAQCVTNLLINAAKFTEPGGQIRVRSTQVGSEACIEVRDSGIGMTPEFLSHAFELFVQNEQALDRSQGGLGIGLAVCRKLITMHGGSVTAVSDGPEQGTTFTIRLPLAVQPHEPDRPAVTADAAPLRILIVDDNRDAADSLELLLQLQGHATRTVYSAEHALECVGSFHPDLALLDIGLPQIDGYEVARRLKVLSPHTRLIAITGYGQAEDRERSSAAGFDAHLVKPIDFAKLAAICAESQPHG